VVVEDGMEGLTIARLASRMNASVGAIYRYFPSKEALIVGLQEMAIADFHTFLETRLAATDRLLEGVTSPVRALGRLMVAFRAYIDHARASPRPHRLVDTFLSFPEAILSDSEARAVNDRLLTPILDSFAALLAEASAVGAIEPADDVQRTHVAWAFAHGLDHFHKRDRISPEPLKLEALLPIARTALLRGFGARTELLAQAEKLVAPCALGARHRPFSVRADDELPPQVGPGERLEARAIAGERLEPVHAGAGLHDVQAGGVDVGVGREGHDPVGLDAREEALGRQAGRDQAERVAHLVRQDGGQGERAELHEEVVELAAVAVVVEIGDVLGGEVSADEGRVVRAGAEGDTADGGPQIGDEQHAEGIAQDRAGERRRPDAKA
jgi:AcrR family transcriptional regulator